MKRIFKATVWMMMVAAALAFGACDDGSSGSMSDVDPAAVSGLTAMTAVDHVTLVWTDPSNAMFDHVEITWTPDGTMPVSVNPGDQTCEITLPADGTAHTFTVTSVFGDDTSFDAAIDTTGEAEIYTAADLDNVRNDLAAHYVLMADIDLGVSLYIDGAGWGPIGSQTSPFAGIFNGNDHIISNLVINAPAVNCVGLFGRINGGYVHDLALESIQVNGGQHTGGLVGMSNCSITNCSTAGTVAGAQNTGGLAGSSSGTLSDCYSAAIVIGTDHNTGGLLGNNEGSVTFCHATGAVSGGINTGGLVGITFLNGIDDCYATGSVTGSGATTGGLVGYNYFDEINRSFATGPVSGTSSCGGLVGDSNGYLTDCYATGAVNGTVFVGGLVGYSFQFSGGSDPVMTNCYAAGLVTGDDQTGGFAGRSSNGIYVHCYYDSDTTGQSDTGKGNSRTTAQMKLTDTSVATYSGWDFAGETDNGTEDIWSIDTSGSVNSGYPYLTDNH